MCAPATKAWLRETGLKAVETMLYTLIGLVTAGTANLLEMNAWATVGAMLAAGVACVAKSALALLKKKREVREK